VQPAARCAPISGLFQRLLVLNLKTLAMGCRC
jgi:hypothetical protein